MTNELTLPDVSAEDAQGKALLEQATALVVTDDASFAQAGTMLSNVVALRKRIEAHYKPVIDAAHKAHKATIAARDEHLTPLGPVESMLRSKVGAYQLAERKRVEEEQRKAYEAQRKAEAEARAAEERARQEAEAKRAAEAFDAACDGDEEKAKEVLAAPVKVEPVAVPRVVMAPVKPAAQVAGLSSREVWSAEVVDLDALLKFCGENPAIGRTLIQPNLSTLNALARAEKAALKIPGVRAVSSVSTAVR